MRQDDFPHPVADPAASGIPEYADDDSTADEQTDSTREADGRSSAALPAEREDGPVALDEFGTTAEEQRRGEPLAGRLIREESDSAVDAGTSGGGASAEEAALHEVPDEDLPG